MIFGFVKRNFFLISTMLIFLNLLSCFFNGFMITYLFLFIISILLESLLFVLDSIILHKGYITDKSVGVLYFHFGIGMIFLVLSFVFRDAVYSYVSIFETTLFITAFLLIKIFDIKEK